VIAVECDNQQKRAFFDIMSNVDSSQLYVEDSQQLSKLKVTIGPESLKECAYLLKKVDGNKTQTLSLLRGNETRTVNVVRGSKTRTVSILHGNSGRMYQLLFLANSQSHHKGFTDGGNSDVSTYVQEEGSVSFNAVTTIQFKERMYLSGLALKQNLDAVMMKQFYDLYQNYKELNTDVLKTNFEFVNFNTAQKNSNDADSIETTSLFEQMLQNKGSDFCEKLTNFQLSVRGSANTDRDAYSRNIMRVS